MTSTTAMTSTSTCHPAPSINTTPLIDVLLVLLVLLIMTLPLSTHKVSLSLPSGVDRLTAPPPRVTVEIDFDGKVFWNGSPAVSDERLGQWFRQTAADPVAPIVQISPDRHARYERVAQVLAAAQRAHVTRLALSPVDN